MRAKTFVIAFFARPLPSPLPLCVRSGKLVLNLVAGDYIVQSSGQLKNRATGGSFNQYANADFYTDVTSNSAAVANKTVRGGVTAILFNGTAAMPARLDSYSGAYNSEVQISTASTWGCGRRRRCGGHRYDGAAADEIPLIQWGSRGSGNCAGAGISLGSAPAFGAGGFYGSGQCNWGFAAGPGMQSATGASGTPGYMPTISAWHYIAVVFSGGNPGYTLVYVDGLLNSNTSTTGVSVVLNQNTNCLHRNDGSCAYVTLGAWLQSYNPQTVASGLSLATLRMPDAALSITNVTFNYNLDAAMFGHVAVTGTPTLTATRSSTASVSSTSSTSATATSTRSSTSSTSGTGSLSAAASSSSTSTGSKTATSSITASAGSSLTAGASSTSSLTSSPTPSNSP